VKSISQRKDRVFKEQNANFPASKPEKGNIMDEIERFIFSHFLSWEIDFTDP